MVRLENQGDAECPYRMKSLWRFADGDLNALVYDISMQVGTRARFSSKELALQSLASLIL